MATNKRLIKSNDEGGGVVPTSFQTITYTGTGSIRNIYTTNDGTSGGTGGFQPDFVWFKNRTVSDNHWLFDSVRGKDKLLTSNTTFREFTNSNFINNFTSDGVQLGTANEVNFAGGSYVAWCWKAGGAAVTNTDGTIISQVSANTEAGFSVVTWTANGLSSATVGHGLNAEPSLIIVKARSGADPVTNWGVYHSSLGNTKYLYLNRTDAAGTSSAFWNNTSPTSSVFTVSNSGNINGLINNMVSYCFAEVAGFSKFGSYVGNGSTSGPTVSLGFEPAFVMIKSTGDKHWVMKDNKRSPSNPRDERLKANLPNAEDLGADVDFNDTNFQVKSASNEVNSSGQTYIYMAFANQF